jgi:hypothetical protein
LTHSNSTVGKKIWISPDIATLIHKHQPNAKLIFIFREMLDVAFMRNDYHSTAQPYWDNQHYIELYEPTDRLIYEKRFSKGHYVPNEPLTNKQRRVLQAIINCDSFWEIPTNLFSYYYDLPDEQDKFHQIINQSL